MKITIELEIPKDVLNEFIDAQGKGEGTPEEQVKAAVIEFIERRVQSHRMHKAMEVVREQQEAAREMARQAKGLGIK